MKLLFITAFPPNQKTGGQTFSRNAINELSKKYTIHVIYFEYLCHECDLIQNSNVSVLKSFAVSNKNIFAHPFTHPIFTRRFSFKILSYINSIAQEYDVLYFDFSQVALYSCYIRHNYKIFRMHDVLAQKFERKNPLLAAWVKHTEKKILSSFSKVFVPSQKDSQIIKKNYSINALYTNEYLKPVHFPELLPLGPKKSFVLYGYWKRAENTDGLIWFIKNVLPLLAIEEYEYTVIGGGLDEEIQKHVLEPNKVKYVGFVEDPMEYIISSTAVIVPLFQGAGVKVKTIDTFTAGTPVIGTSLAFEGLPNISGLCFECESPKDFAEKIKEIKPLELQQKKELSSKFIEIYDNNHLLQKI